MRGAKPTHTLVVRRKTVADGAPSAVGPSFRVGAAWERDGFISIVLDPCVTLADRSDLFISLVPVEEVKHVG